MVSHKNKSMEKILKEIKTRWKAESPIFWKKILNKSITIGTIAVSIIGVEKLFGLIAYGVPGIIFTVCGYIIVACAALGLAAKITKE